MANAKKKASGSRQKPDAKKTSDAAVSASWDKKEKALRNEFPNLTDNDLHRYAGENDESILRRVADRTGKLYEEVLEVAG